ncbi:lysozyme [Mucilaginibacter sp.]|jgi:lysozyme|uniref:lysozyme n=1 Tax=Mucilaginibacter sp. TaxID=1882438 RepID=UPI003564D336
MKKLSEHGINVIKKFEGLRLKAYQDVAGVWTIGYGSTLYHDGKPVKSGDKLAEETQADALFHSTLKTYIDAVNKLVGVSLNQNQFDALVSFTYNLGTGALQKSTLLRKLNASDYIAAADQFLLWNKITDPHSGKKVVCNTLTVRRRQERELFLKPIKQ